MFLCKIYWCGKALIGRFVVLKTNHLHQGKIKPKVPRDHSFNAPIGPTSLNAKLGIFFCYFPTDSVICHRSASGLENLQCPVLHGITRTSTTRHDLIAMRTIYTQWCSRNFLGLYTHHYTTANALYVYITINVHFAKDLREKYQKQTWNRNLEQYL